MPSLLGKTLKRLFFVLLLLAGIPLAVYSVKLVTNLFPKAAPETVEIFFNPENSSIPYLGTRSIQLMLDAKTNQIGFTRVELTFDTSKIKLNSEIQTTNKLKTVVQKTSMADANSSGRVVIALGLAAEDKANPPTGVFDLATLVFKSNTSSPNQSASIVIDGGKVQIVDLVPNELSFTTRSANLTIQICSPGEKRCSGNTAETCNANGTDWNRVTCTTDQYCEVGECKNYVCQVGETRCSGDNPQICASDRKGWGASTNDAVCGGNRFCDSGSCVTPGDANRDGNVDGQDYIIWLNHYNQTTGNGIGDGDFNKNGKVDGLDYVIWLNNYVG